MKLSYFSWWIALLERTVQCSHKSIIIFFVSVISPQYKSIHAPWIVTGLRVESEKINMLRKTNGIFRLKKEPFIMRALSEIYIWIVTETTRCYSLCCLFSQEIFPRAWAEHIVEITFEHIINHSSLFFTFPFRWKIS